MRIVLFDIIVSGHHLKYALPLIKFLKKQGKDVLFITNEKIKNREEFNELKSLVEMKYIQDNKPKNKLCKYLDKIKIIWKVYKVADKWNADIFHFLYFDFFEIPLVCYELLSLLGFNNYNFKVIGTLHWIHFLGKKFGEQRSKLEEIFDKFNELSLQYLLKYNKLNNLLVHNDILKKMLVNQFRNNDMNDMIKVIPYPTDTFNLAVSQSEARNQLDLPTETPLFLVFGGLRYDKGIDLLLKALKTIDDEYKLIIAGKEAYFTEKDIDDMIKKHQLNDKVIKRIKFIPNNEVGLYFLSCNAVILPYREVFKGQSGPLLQACYARKPIIAFNSGMIGKIIKKNRIGLLAQTNSIKDLRNKIRYFLTNTKKISHKLDNNLKKYYKNNTYDKMVSNIMKNYKELL